ncbi:unnamed protein product [Linum trigynum]|uniref:Uncharacterized protein n=1 Tax=Linum trigynum TaxID=586398 RepID=A0AAV2DHK8_9ROSI
MAAFSLTSDRQFVAGLKDDPNLYVYEYLGDLNESTIIRPGQPWSSDGVIIGPSQQTNFKALEVFGVIISDKLFMELVKDLNLKGYNGQTFRLVVNRRGCCLLDRVNDPSSFAMLRINDCFGWSKYGVKLPKFTSADVWNRCDMYNGATVVDVRGIMVATEKEKDVKVELAMCRKELECTKEMVRKSGEAESLLNRFVEEKEKEVERVVKIQSARHEKELELTKEAVKRGEEIELLLRKSVEEKEKEVEKMSNLLAAERKQVVSLKAVICTFVDGHE